MRATSKPEKNVYRVQKWRVRGQVYDFKLFMVVEPVPDQNSLMETNIIPDNNKPGLLSSVLLSCIMKCI
jgi:hypothetical protein